MRRYYDEYAAHGWAATMWSYKLLHRRGGAGGDFWGMVANEDPLRRVDLATSTFEELQAFFAWLGTSPLAVNEALRHQLTTDRPDPVPLTSLPADAGRAGARTGPGLAGR
jgi:endoglucanase